MTDTTRTTGAAPERPLAVWMGLAAASGFLGVCAGAFGAHGMADPTGRELLRTGATYELIHALAALAAVALARLGARRARIAAALFLAGSALFSGSLYALALGAPRLTGVVTPLGGLLFLAGWAALAWAARGIDQTAR
jgi:uncharacterized membrane protein YgdD (TMEM256/DUF423 family)